MYLSSYKETHKFVIHSDFLVLCSVVSYVTINMKEKLLTLLTDDLRGHFKKKTRNVFIETHSQMDHEYSVKLWGSTGQ